MKAALCLILAAVALCMLAVPAQSRVLFIDEFPHYQTFDHWDTCYYDGTCYELQCLNLPDGWYNPVFRSDRPVYPAVRNWWVIDQQTPTNWASDGTLAACNALNTGPCADHTTGTAGDGKFLYIESTSCFGVNFYIVTPTFLFNNTGAQISFYYYIFGRDVTTTYINASIAVEYSVNNGTWVEAFKVIGNVARSSAQWKYSGIIHIGAAIGNNGTASSPTPVTFRFVGVTGKSAAGSTDNFFSDLAIDDIWITQDDAPNTTVPYIEPNNTKPPPVIPSPVVNKESGDGLSTGDIVGIVVGIVGGVCLLCCCCCLLLIALLLIISPRKPPDEQAAGGDL